jgi:predicted transcriptional regulator
MDNKNLMRAKYSLSNYFKARPQLKKVLACYFMNASHYKPTMTQLSKELGMRKQHISRAFKELMKLEVVKKISEKKFGRNIGSKTPVYTFTERASASFEAWLDMHTNFKMVTSCAQVGATDVTSMDGEQEEGLSSKDLDIYEDKDNFDHFWSKNKGDENEQ